MSAGFIHLSDIHFGQEKGGDIYVHEDIKACVINDVAQAVKLFEAGRAAGVLVTGDIAYSGLACEYEAAGKWLDKIAKAAGCEITEIQVVPGNHDVDRGSLTVLTKKMLADIADRGQDALNDYMATEDSQLLFKRFRHYLAFAEGYRCPIDTIHAKSAEDRVLELAPGKSIRFVRLNSALTSFQNEEDGKLLLGQGQHIIKERPGEEQIVLSHHPLHCFKDCGEATKFVQYRARVFISGHEHNPSCNFQKIEQGRDLLMIAAGATIPPHNQPVQYCFNLIEFDWDKNVDGLSVKVFPRIWNRDILRFEAGLPNQFKKLTLECPNFAKSSPAIPIETLAPESSSSDTIVISPPSNTEEKQVKEDMTKETYALLILRFFRDISHAERLEILTKLGAIPQNWNGNLTEAILRTMVDSLVKKGRSAEVWAQLKEKLQGKN